MLSAINADEYELALVSAVVQGSPAPRSPLGGACDIAVSLNLKTREGAPARKEEIETSTIYIADSRTHLIR